MHPSFSRCFRNAAITLALAAMTLGAFGGPVLAEDDDEPFEQKIMRNLLGNPRGDIDYRERSPLVIPPGRDLPQPEAGAGATAHAAWPKDPDSAKNARSASRPVSDPDKSARPLSPDEIKRGTISRREGDRRPAASGTDNELGRAMMPSEYNREGKGRSLFSLWGAKPEAETFREEPTRSRMTQPPAGYQTPASGQPYAPPKEESMFKLPSIFDRGLGIDK